MLYLKTFEILLDNAVKYTPKGIITIKLEIARALEKDKPSKLKITIADTGEGMSQGEISKLFQTFSRAGAGPVIASHLTGLAGACG